MAINMKKMERLYIHVPFCSRKCDYCAFYSVPAPSQDSIQAYLNRLESEFMGKHDLCSELKSIFIGGGTPSLLNPTQLSKLFEGILANFAISDHAEISIECNPESLDSEKAQIIANFANRVSVGVQSFNNDFRKTIGRYVKQSAIYRAFELLTSHGLKNIGCDLIYAIPGETLSDWEKELKEVVSLPVSHVSAYSLTYEEGTRLNQQNSDLKAESSEPLHLENETSMWEMAGDYLMDKNFLRYEISNYSKPGYKCQHNDGIWHGETYLGCGPAATSFDGYDRWTNAASLEKWLSGEKPEIDQIPEENRAREIFIMGLRTVDGWNKKVFYDCTGIDWQDWNNELRKPIDAKLIINTSESIRCTDQGLLLWNEIAECLI